MRTLLWLLLTAALPYCALADPIISYDGPPASAVTTAFVKTGAGTFASSCSDGAGSASDAGFAISYDGAACVGESTQPFSLDGNGVWQGMPLIGDASAYTTITIDLGGYFSYAGGFMNYGFFAAGFDIGPLGSDPTVAALDANRHIIQSYDIFGIFLDQDTDVNRGFFLGISSAAQDISYLQISGSQIVMSQVSVILPEPATWTLAGMAIAALALFVRHRPA